MKKAIILLIASVMLMSCEHVTTAHQDREMLQKHFSTVYQLDAYRYIVADSLHIYDVKVTLDGKIKSKVKIK